MSTGLVICSACKREVHQDGEKIDDANPRGWTHCEDKTPRCEGAESVYPEDVAEIVGRYCQRDGRAPKRAPAQCELIDHATGKRCTRDAVKNVPGIERFQVIAICDQAHERPERAPEARRSMLTGRRSGGSGSLRNDPCPCGSGRKRKRCCNS